MNTKTLTLTAAFLLLLLQLNSSGAFYNKASTPHQSTTQENRPQNSNSRPAKTQDWALTLPADDGHSQSHHNDHDDTSHCFCYDRFNHCRRRLLFILIIKMFLLVAHAGTFVATIMQLWHR